MITTENTAAYRKKREHAGMPFVLCVLLVSTLPLVTTSFLAKNPLPITAPGVSTPLHSQGFKLVDRHQQRLGRNGILFRKFKRTNNFITPSLLALSMSDAASSDITTASTTTTASSTTTPADTSSLDDPFNDGILYTLPPPNRKLSKLESEFRSMMDDFSRYTARDIACLENPRDRALFEGVAAGALEPAVYRAFEVLFEDLVPLRIAGRMIYRNLSDVMVKSREKRRMEEESIASSTGLSLREIDHGRKAFMAIIDEDDEGELTIEQLVNAGIVDTVVELMGYDDFDELVARLDVDERGKLNFEKFLIGLQRCAEGSCAAECHVGTVLEEIVKRMEPIEEQKRQMTLTDRKKRYGVRYDEMVRAFIEWEDRVPDGEGRRLDVLRGCFVGARNEKVVRALKIAYIDYSALRLAGDVVFKLMSALIGSRKKK